MKIVHTQTKWGNLYRSRYYINGLRVTEAEYSYQLRLEKEAAPAIEPEHERLGGMGPDYRTTYNFPYRGAKCRR